MTRVESIPAGRAGFSMIEVLVALMIVVLGLLGLAGLQVRMQQAEFESYQRAQALVLLQDMVDRINIHRTTKTCFAITTNADGTPYMGMGSTVVPACSASTTPDNTEANTALTEWHSLLLGAGETSGGASVGAMVGARGCISYAAGTEVPEASGAPIAGTGIYTIAVSWQGNLDTFTPTVSCGNNLYGADTRRRTVSTTLRIAHLH